MPTDVVENIVNKKLQGTEIAVEMLLKRGMSHRTQDNGGKYPRLVGITES